MTSHRVNRLLHRPREASSITPTAKQLQRIQWRKTTRAFAIFFIFAALVAPLEYHLKWINLCTNSWAFYDALEHPLPTGILYFYALIMAIEALLVFSLYPEIKDISFMWLTQFGLWIVVGLFFIDYVVTGHYPAPWNGDAPKIPPYHWELYVQFGAALAALASSFLVHCAAIKFESRLSDPK